MPGNISYIAINYMNARLFVLLFFAVVTGLLSCKDKDLPQAAGLTTRLNVINTTTDTIKFYINGSRQNNLTDIFIGGASGYLTVLAGQQDYRFSKSNGSTVLLNTAFTLDTAKYYSIFFCGPTKDQAFRIADPIDSVVTAIAADTLDTDLNNAFVRFVNTSPAISALDVSVGGGDTVNIKNSTFGAVSNFKPFISGTKSVKVYLSGTATPVIDTPLVLPQRRGYTLVTHGQINGTGSNAFGVSVIINVQ